jgi:hypothetical protein
MMRRLQRQNELLEALAYRHFSEKQNFRTKQDLLQVKGCSKRQFKPEALWSSGEIPENVGRALECPESFAREGGCARRSCDYDWDMSNNKSGLKNR